MKILNRLSLLALFGIIGITIFSFNTESILSKLKSAQQIYTLAMISPFSSSEKQKLLEIVNLNEIAKTLNEITMFGFYEDSNEKNIIQ